LRPAAIGRVRRRRFTSGIGRESRARAALRSMTATFGMPQFGSLTGIASLY
jgi:hypothetical protein